MNKPTCHICKSQTQVKLRHDIMQNGEQQWYWCCLDCERRTPATGHNVPKETVRSIFKQYGVSWDVGCEMTLRYDNRENGSVCCVCGRSDVELHHFAPQSLASHFGDDWLNWPTVYLCRDHHRLWHEVVTPYLPGYNSSPTARMILEAYYEVAGP